MTVNHIAAPQAPTPRPIQFVRATSHATLGRRRRVLTRAVESDRSRVVAGFRALANGVDAHTAAARTNAFYRASGLSWARCLG
jgi:hypothetical protein